MGLAELDRIDIVATAPDGCKRLTAFAHSWAREREALYAVQLLIKMSGLVAHAEHLREGGDSVAIELISGEEPPAPLLEWLQERGVECTVGVGQERQPARGREPEYPFVDGEPDLAVLQRENAATFAREHGLPLPPSMGALERLDAIVEARRSAIGLAADETDEELSDGNLTVLAGAYAG